jgi:AcrR family transcriptional regulator
MHRLLGQLNLKINEQVFVKDPMSSTVGQEILRHSVNLIAQEGLEHFNFKKLAAVLGSTETTIYRYFHNKQQLMIYLASWYWSTLEWKIAFATANVETPRIRLDKAIVVLSAPVGDHPQSEFLNETKLYSIVVSESFKAFAVRSLSKKERVGYFEAYSKLCNRVAELISQNNKHYKFPKALAATLIETAHYQTFLQSQLPELTDITKGAALNSLLHQIAFKALEEKA